MITPAQMSQATGLFRDANVSKKIKWFVKEGEGGLESDIDTMYSAENSSKRGLPGSERNKSNFLNHFLDT